MAELNQLPESAAAAVATDPQPATHGSALLADLFPLPLTPFEHYMVVDDSSTQPLTSIVQLIFCLPLNHARLRTACAQALERNPLLASRIVPTHKSWAWVYDSTWKLEIRSFANQPPCINGQILPMDLRHEPGLRLWLDQQAHQTRLIFQLHHACADGIGARRFLVDMLICYARTFATADEAELGRVKLDRLNHSRLLERGCMAHLERTRPVRVLTAWERTKNFIYFFFRPPVPLVGASQSGSQRRDIDPAELSLIEPTEILRLGAKDSADIIERARVDEVGLNELGLALLFHVCRLWHEMHGSRGSNKRIRLLMPYDMRSKEDLRLSAANCMSFSFLGRTHAQCNDWHALLRSVQAETQDIKATRVYADFLNGLKAGMARPALLRWIVRRSRNMATVVFTYAGDVHRGLSRTFADEDGYTRIGDTLFQDALAAPPVRTNTNISLGLCIGKGRICISAAWNRRVLSAAETQQFLTMFAEAWRNWARNGTPQS